MNAAVHNISFSTWLELIIGKDDELWFAYIKITITATLVVPTTKTIHPLTVCVYN